MPPFLLFATSGDRFCGLVASLNRFAKAALRILFRRQRARPPISRVPIVVCSAQRYWNWFLNLAAVVSGNFVIKTNSSSSDDEFIPCSKFSESPYRPGLSGDHTIKDTSGSVFPVETPPDGRYRSIALDFGATATLPIGAEINIHRMVCSATPGSGERSISLSSDKQISRCPLQLNCFSQIC